MLCTILGGGLSKGIVPGFSMAMAHGEKEKWRLLTGLFYITLLFSIVLSMINIIAAPYIIRIIFPPDSPSDSINLAVMIYRLLSLAITGGMISGLFIGAANTFHLYGHTTLRSVAYNSMILVCLVTLHKKIGIFSLGAGLLLAEFSQILVVLPPLWKRGFRPYSSSTISRKIIKIVAWAWFPAVILGGMSHFNYLIDRSLAINLREGCVSSLYYAWKLILLPTSLLSVAFATPFLTFLSHHEAREERNLSGKLFMETVGTLLFFSLPVTFLLILTRTEIVTLFFDWGRFDNSGVILTSSALFFYSPGLPFQLLLPLLAAGFIAIRKPWIPVLVSLPLLPLNWLLDRILMVTLYHAGIALSTSMIFFINFSILYLILRRYLQSEDEINLSVRHTAFILCVVILFFGIRKP